MKKFLTLSFLLCVFLQTMAYEWTDGNGVSWTFTVNGSKATITECSIHDGDVSIPSKVYLDEKEYTVTSIGRVVFEHSSLTSVTIPKSVTSIGYDAFYSCEYLSKVYIYDLTAWCKISFYNNASNPLINGGHLYLDNTEITNLVIPSGVKSISNYAFIGGTGLTSVTIPKSVTSIGESAFDWCSNLTEVIVSDIAAWCRISFGNPDANPLSYAKHLFYNNANTEITDLVIPGGVTSINDYAFYNCSNLTSATIPEGVASIGSSAFYGCTNLTRVTIYDGVTSIGDSAFRMCTNLSDLTIPSSVTSIANFAFYNCICLTSVKVLVNDMAAFCNNQVIGQIRLRLNHPVQLIDSDGNEITELVIPDGVESIGNYAFWDCKGLTSVTIPEGVTSVGSYAFAYCSGLTSVTIPEGVTSIGNGAFEGCIHLTNMTFPLSLTSIGVGAFLGCFSLTKVIVPDIAAWCHINFGNPAANPLSYAKHLFYNNANTEITDLVIPGGVTSINDYAFYYCSGLTSVTIPDGVTSIGNYAFNFCSGLTSVTIPDGVTSIGRSAFEGCSGLTSVTIPSSVTSIDNGAFSDCSGLTSVTIEEGVTSIGNYAFLGCSGLTSVTIPSSVTSIGNSAFRVCSSLKSVTIPEGVTSIGDYAFNDCSSLTSVYCYIKTPLEITKNAFTNRANATLYVPYGCKSAYQNAYCWKEFKEIVEKEDTGESSGIITNIAAPDNGEIRVYGVNGQLQPALRPGVNIIRMSDGTTRKVLGQRH